MNSNESWKRLAAAQSDTVKKGLTIAGFGMFTFLILYGLLTLVTAFCLDYTLDTWMAYAKKPEEDFLSYGECYLLALIPYVGQMTIIAAIITFFLMLFL